MPSSDKLKQFLDFTEYASIIFFIFTLLTSTAGFGPAGIAAKSYASALQSLIGNVQPGSLFSLLQSLGAKGVIIGGKYVSLVSLCKTKVLKKYIIKPKL